MLNQLEYDKYLINNLAPNTPRARIRQTHGRLSVLGHWDKLTIDSKIYLSKWDGIVNLLVNLDLIKSFDPATGLPASFCSSITAGFSAFTNAYGFNDSLNDFHDVAVNNNVSGNSPHKTVSDAVNVKA
jgi:iron complex outermembrane receptor protein